MDKNYVINYTIYEETKKIYDEVLGNLSPTYIGKTNFGKQLNKALADWNYEAAYEFIQSVKEKRKNKSIEDVLNEDWGLQN